MGRRKKTTKDQTIGSIDATNTFRFDAGSIKPTKVVMGLPSGAAAPVVPLDYPAAVSQGGVAYSVRKKMNVSTIANHNP